MVFNAQQQRVIEVCSGRHLVLAPPGCGKTAVLAERIVHAHRQGVAFADMACLTFTNRAARSMHERIVSRLGDNIETVDDLFVGNIHRFCLHYLFDSGLIPNHTAVIDTDTSISIIADYLGDDELRVLDDNRSRQRYSQIINLQHIVYQVCHGYPKKLLIHMDAMPPNALNELCRVFALPYKKSGLEQLYVGSSHYLTESAMMSSDARQLLQALHAAHEYEAYKRTNDLLDYEDILLRTYDAVITTDPARSFRWLQIDEVQDLNPLQLAIVDYFTATDATVVYLGDMQQAIFSFMGAQTDTLSELRQRCGDDHFYSFQQNYRSPQYLLDIFNHFAQTQLNIAPELLPNTDNQQQRKAGDVILMDAQTNVDEANMVARLVRQFYEQHPQQTTAVVVAFNSDADEVSAALGDQPHFKISGTDFFSTQPVLLLMAHLGVLNMEHDFIAWSHLFTGLKIYASNSSARQAIHAMMQLALSPADLLLYDGTSYVAQFVNTYERGDIVVFDTETTGLDVFNDDVVQIAAVRTRQGRVVNRLNIFVETDRPIPAILGDVPNPLVEEYARQPHLTHAEGLRRFVHFAQGATILGHNATYDYQIMEHNMRRYAPELSMHAAWPHYLDSLKLARLLHPMQKSYKLRNLLEQLHLEGKNSHLADDDILATLSLVIHCYECARSIVGHQMEFLSRHQNMAVRLRQRYAPLYLRALHQLHAEAPGPLLSLELQHAYSHFLQEGLIGQLPKLKYIISYIEQDMLTPKSGQSLASQLARHYSDLCTMKEADLCGSASMTERVFVSTVHKAKGLEFDNVIVYDAVDGKYPSVYAKDRSQFDEEARKFYVAISRARRRLIVTYCHNSISRWGVIHAKVPSPFMTILRSSFI